MIRSGADIPDFATEEDERGYGDTHSFSEEYFDGLEEVPVDFLPPPQRDGAQNIPLDSRTARRLSAVAHARDTTPAALARQFLRERLAQEEQRTGS
jgi:hypothetical protein